jgi:hypothetical protein
MQIGLLWFDSDPGRGLATKIEDAARHYREKFGVSPNTCYVNSAALARSTGHSINGNALVGTALRIIPATNILPHHFWVGVEEQQA